MHTDLGYDSRSGRALTHRPRRAGRVTAAAVALCVALASLGGLAGYWWSTQGGDEVRTAEAVVLLRPLEGNPFNPEGAGTELVNMETEAQLVRSTVVTGLAADELGQPDNADAIRGGVTSTVPANTQLVRVTASALDEQEAVDRAQVLAETFLAYRQERSETYVAERSAQLREEIKALEKRRRQVVQRLGDAGPERPITVVREQRIDEITTQLGEFRVQRTELEAATADPGQVVTDAAAAKPGLLSSAAIFPVLGALAGLAIALVLLGGRRRLDERVHGPDDLVHTGVPVLGRLPGSAEHRPGAIGGVRAAVLAAEPTRPLVLGVAVGSAGGVEEGLATTSDLTGELGLSLRRAGMGVAVLDLASRPDADEGGAGPVSLDTDPLLPLSALLDLEQDLVDVLARRRASGLPLAVVNDLGREELADRASSPEMDELLAALRGVADAVVADIGSLDEASAQSLVGAVDAVVLTVREGSATFGELESSLQRAPMWGGRIAGLVCVAEVDERGGRRRRGSSRGRGSRRVDAERDTTAPSAQGSGSSGTRVSTLVAEGPR